MSPTSLSLSARSGRLAAMGCVDTPKVPLLLIDLNRKVGEVYAPTCKSTGGSGEVVVLCS